MRTNLTHFVAAIVRRKLCILAAAIALLPAIGWAQEFTVTDLGTLGGPFSAATSVNNEGQVAGQSNTATQDSAAGQTDPFLYSKGKMIDLGNFGGSSGSTGPDSPSSNIANAVNDNGQVAGLAFSADGSPHPFLWSAGILRDLAPGQTGAAFGINASGTATGFLGTGYDDEGDFYGFGAIFYGVSSFAGVVAPPSLYVSSPTAINSLDQVAGNCSGDGDTVAYACIAEGATAQALLPLNPYYSSLATAINNGGSTCGASLNDFSHMVATAWIGIGGAPVDLGGPPNTVDSVCLGMDDFGQYVGISNSYASNQIAFFWDPVHGARDLNTLIPKFSVKGHAVKIQNAAALSHTGFIAADCLLEDGQSHACLLTPNTVLILHDSILGLAANANNVCIPCEEELAPEARSLPKSLDGLTARERERVVSTVDRIGEQVEGLERRGDISAPIATLLIHQAELVLSAIDPKR
jgi:probable HAF family extracellular repeat protein